ncbi:nucleotidyl transferase AbiEii/AbiGii toxin family protein [Bradyrhizobium sp. SEMIA]|uniref:nucleotidyl transferase AbiEii/AbiGii toxin family protein n=1 Tax=Bradyrhizobium sp. SEMIA TaxID=2597515 RepID=UPI0018A404A7|nr:nucleotidyl transferase AbiEii/AbiGii toxin family protein [Bradyrhizobium sp. SEMIA]QOG21763.1 nucleotidyl transferase AbiEii/AbiGii toxin family protein [Bradyrhizobium sp. SEMIA]
MAFADAYKKQVALLLRVLPFVAEEKCFALKGGTAINLFVRDLPRLSVDIDLTYIPVAPRAESLSDIDAAMKRTVAEIKEKIPGAQVHEARKEGTIVKLVVRSQNVQIKIEVTPVLRGCVFEPVVTSVRPAVEEAFGFAEARTVSFADLYGGKIVAALDRQHPRDLFDIRDLLANEGITDELRKAFIVYLLSHDRPMFEVLGSPQKDISDEFLHGFEGMTDKPVSKDELVAARKTLVEEIVGKMPEAHRKFLVSFERGEPDWDLLGIPAAADLPAVKWRQQNLDKLSKEKRAELVAALEKVLKSRA